MESFENSITSDSEQLLIVLLKYITIRIYNIILKIYNIILNIHLR